MCSFLEKKSFTFFSSNRIILYLEKWGISKIVNQSTMGHGTPLMHWVIQMLLSQNDFAKCYLFCRGSLSSLLHFFFSTGFNRTEKKPLKSEYILVIREVISQEIKIDRRKIFPSYSVLLNCAAADKNKNYNMDLINSENNSSFLYSVYGTIIVPSCLFLIKRTNFVNLIYVFSPVT